MKASLKTAASYGLRLTGVDRLIGNLTGTSRIPAVISYHRVVEHFEETGGAAAVLDVRLTDRVRRAKIKHVEVRQKFHQVRGDARLPSATPFHPAITSSRTFLVLNRLHRRSESDVARVLSMGRVCRCGHGLLLRRLKLLERMPSVVPRASPGETYFVVTCLPRNSRISWAISSPFVSRAK